MNEMLRVFGAVGSRSQQTTNIRDLERILLQASDAICCWPSTGHKTRWLLWFTTLLFLALVPALNKNFSTIFFLRAFHKVLLWSGYLSSVSNFLFFHISKRENQNRCEALVKWEEVFELPQKYGLLKLKERCSVNFTGIFDESYTELTITEKIHTFA